MIIKGERQLTPALTDLIDDSTISSNKTYSSNKINVENNIIDTKIDNEILRATTKETEINTNLQTEITRSTTKDNELTTAISNETTRATTKENEIETTLNNKLNKSWQYVGILSASSGSVLTVGDDWSELCFAIRVNEGSVYYNLSNVIPKVCFTQGSPKDNNTFIGFNWNVSYNAKIRVGLTGSGNNRQIKNSYSDAVGWGINGIYVWKR